MLKYIKGAADKNGAFNDTCEPGFNGIWQIKPSDGGDSSIKWPQRRGFAK